MAETSTAGPEDAPVSKSLDSKPAGVADELAGVAPATAADKVAPEEAAVTDSKGKSSSRSRPKSRSRSRERKRSPSKDRVKSLSGSERRRSRSRDNGTRRRSSSRSRDKEKERRRSRSRDRGGKKDRSRSRDRRRSRSRSPRRYRTRSRSRSRGRRWSRSPPRGGAGNTSGGALPPPPMGGMMGMSSQGNTHLSVPGAPQQALQMQMFQQQALQQLQQQQLAAAASMPAINPTADKRSREVFIGNLARGIVTSDMLKELFNSVLGSMVENPILMPPVITSRLDSTGKFGFVELRNPELASAATQLNRMELCGKPMTVERAKGYVDTGASMLALQQRLQAMQAMGHTPHPLLASAAGLSNMGMGMGIGMGTVPGLPPGVTINHAAAATNPAAAAVAAAAAAVAASQPGMVGMSAGGAGLPPPPAVNTVIVLENVMNVGLVRNENERRDLTSDVQGECVKFGTVVGIAIPVPPPHVPAGDACRVYIKFGALLDAQRCLVTMDGRTFDDNKIKAFFASDADFARAQAGEWLASASSLPPAAQRPV